MIKQWLGICVIASLFVAACTSNNSQQQITDVPAQLAVCNGPLVEISGADPVYEPLNISNNQDYQRGNKIYKIVQDLSRFSQDGLAAVYDAKLSSNQKTSGEIFHPIQITAAHPTLPIPSYARITNLENGRMIVVCINDRGPYDNDHVISLSRAAADRLDIYNNNTKVRIDPIIVAKDRSLSGPGTACITVAKQTYALPARPDLSGNMVSSSAITELSQSQGEVCAISNDTLKNTDTTGVLVKNSGLLVDPTTLASGVLEGSETTSAAIVVPVTDTVTASDQVLEPVAAVPVSTSGSFVVQVGAIGNQTRAQMYLQRLSQQFGVLGRVEQNGAIWRIQMGPFTSKSQAMLLQQRLLSEAQLKSFLVVTK